MAEYAVGEVSEKDDEEEVVEEGGELVMDATFIEVEDE